LRAALVFALLPVIVGLILSRPFFGVCLFIFTTFIRPQDLTWGFEEVRFALVIALTTAAGWAMNRRSFAPTARASAVPWIWALMGAMLLSTLTAQVSIEASLEWNDRFVKIAIFSTLLSCVVDRHDRIDRTFFWYLAGMGALALWALQQHYAGNERLEGIGNGGATDSSNEIACAFAMAVPLAVAAAVNERRRIFRWGFLALAPLFALDTVFSQSRAGFLALGASGLWAMRYRRLRLKVFLILTAGAIAFFSSSYVKRAETIVEQGEALDQSADGSIAMRVQLWEFALGCWTTNPVTGVGQQNSALLVKDQTGIGKAKSIHETWIQVLVDGGAIALCCYLGALIAGFRDLKRARIESEERGDERTWRWAIALECAFAAFATSATFNSFDYLEMPYWFLVLAGTIRAVGAREARSNDEAPSLSSAALA